MKIKFNAKSDKDLIILEAGIEIKMRKVIINALKACVKMKPYIISYDLSGIRNRIAARTRIYSVTFSPKTDADVIEMLDNALDVGKLIKFLLRCYSFGKGYPDYRLLNLVYMKSHYFNEDAVIRFEPLKSAGIDGSPENFDIDYSNNELLNFTIKEMM